MAGPDNITFEVTIFLPNAMEKFRVLATRKTAVATYSKMFEK